MTVNDKLRDTEHLKPADKKTSARKNTVKPKPPVVPGEGYKTPQEYIVESVKEEAEKIRQDVDEIREVVEEHDKRFHGKTVDEIKQLQQDALWVESEAKRKLYLLRIRAANVSTDANSDMEKAIVVAKEELAKAQRWLAAIEKRLEGELKDIYGTKF